MLTPTRTVTKASPVRKKSLPSLYWQKPEGKGKKECMRWVLSLLNEHLKENKRPQRYALKNGNLVVGMENN